MGGAITAVAATTTVGTAAVTMVGIAATTMVGGIIVIGGEQKERGCIGWRPLSLKMLLAHRVALLRARCLPCNGNHGFSRSRYLR